MTSNDKKLILLRHAKSSWDYPLLPDFARPLQEKGIQRMASVGVFLQKKQIIPQQIISSYAVRAYQTAVIAAAALKYSPENITIASDLYFQGSHSILQYLKQQSDQQQVIMLVGHNPDFSDLAELLLRKNIEMPTAGVLLLEWKHVSWQNFDQDLPKNALSFFKNDLKNIY
ncbi:MAG: histidine phosphatase family protein [Chitinophagales bacterium]|nr:histidine phosphatase family protein [Bacteroidota bacterium]